jgi:hypothetical protein
MPIENPIRVDALGHHPSLQDLQSISKKEKKRKIVRASLQKTPKNQEPTNKTVLIRILKGALA